MITIVVKGVSYQAVKKVCAGVQFSTLSTKAHTTVKTSCTLACLLGLV